MLREELINELIEYELNMLTFNDLQHIVKEYLKIDLDRHTTAFLESRYRMTFESPKEPF